ncbi:hypothetical protein TNCV_603261 [Trichonephila clavipes]|nr:hypothetical protein TNCV_603261 [Trichonephila clavipes]
MNFCAFGLLKRASGKWHPRTLNVLWKTVEEEWGKIGITKQGIILLSRKIRARAIVKNHSYQIEANRSKNTTYIVVGCSPDDVSVLQYVSPKHSTHVRGHPHVVESEEYAGQSIRVISSLNSKSPMWPCIVIHKNEVWANGTSEQTHMGKKYLLRIAIPGYRPSIENVELSPPV